MPFDSLSKKVRIRKANFQGGSAVAMKKKRLIERLRSDEFLVSVQLDPPGAAQTFESFSQVIAELKKHGVWLIDVNSSRKVSHDSIQVAVALARFGFEVIPHVTTRDASVNGVVNQILAAYDWACVENYLVITGDPYEVDQSIIPSHGVFQTNSIGALRAIHAHLREKKRADEIVLAASVNQYEIDSAAEKKKLSEKIQAGADFFMSQPVFSHTQVGKLYDLYYRLTDKPLLVGIWPLLNQKTVQKIRDGAIVGVALPDDVYTAARSFGDNKEALYEWGIGQMKCLIERLSEDKRARGVYIVAPARDPKPLIPFFRELFL